MRMRTLLTSLATAVTGGLVLRLPPRRPVHFPPPRA